MNQARRLRQGIKISYGFTRGNARGFSQIHGRE
jgi:hypothetical protein